MDAVPVVPNLCITTEAAALANSRVSLRSAWAARAVDRFEEILDSDDDANENWIDEEENDEEEEEENEDEEHNEEEDAISVSLAAPAPAQTGALKIVMRRR